MLLPPSNAKSIKFCKIKSLNSISISLTINPSSFLKNELGIFHSPQIFIWNIEMWLIAGNLYLMEDLKSLETTFEKSFVLHFFQTTIKRAPIASLCVYGSNTLSAVIHLHHLDLSQIYEKRKQFHETFSSIRWIGYTICPISLRISQIKTFLQIEEELLAALFRSAKWIIFEYYEGMFWYLLILINIYWFT